MGTLEISSIQPQSLIHAPTLTMMRLAMRAVSSLKEFIGLWLHTWELNTTQAQERLVSGYSTLLTLRWPLSLQLNLTGAPWRAKPLISTVSLALPANLMASGFHLRCQTVTTETLQRSLSHLVQTQSPICGKPSASCLSFWLNLILQESLQLGPSIGLSCLSLSDLQI